MPASEALVETSRALRYVTQLRDHFAHEPGGMHAESDSDEHVFIDFGRGTLSVRAQPQGLLLHAEAPDPESLGRLQRGVTERLERIGHRDGLAVHWNAATPRPE